MTMARIDEQVYTCDRCQEIQTIQTKTTGLTPLPSRWVEFECSEGFHVEDAEQPNQLHLCESCRGMFNNFMARTAMSLVEGPKFAKALIEIAEMSGENEEKHYVDEWTEAEAFTKCQDIAKKALGREVTK